MAGEIAPWDTFFEPVSVGVLVVWMQSLAGHLDVTISRPEFLISALVRTSQNTTLIPGRQLIADADMTLSCLDLLRRDPDIACVDISGLEPVEFVAPHHHSVGRTS